MGWLKKTQRTAYRVSRTAGDVSAAKRGKLGKRIVRRKATRAAFRLFR